MTVRTELRETKIYTCDRCGREGPQKFIVDEQGTRCINTTRCTARRNMARPPTYGRPYPTDAAVIC